MGREADWSVCRSVFRSTRTGREADWSDSRSVFRSTRTSREADWSEFVGVYSGALGRVGRPTGQSL